MIDIAQNEPFADTKLRLQQRLGISDKDFARYKFTLVNGTVFRQPSTVEEGEIFPHGSMASD